MSDYKFKNDLPKQQHTICKKYGICIKSCWSGCQTGEAIQPEDMVQYGWPLDAAKKHQAEFS